MDGDLVTRGAVSPCHGWAEGVATRCVSVFYKHYMKNCASLRQALILRVLTGVLVMHSPGCVLSMVCLFFFLFKLLIKFRTSVKMRQSLFSQRISHPEGGRELGYSTLQNLVDTKKRLYRVLRPLFTCLARRKPPAACVLWEECGIPAFLR